MFGFCRNSGKRPKSAKGKQNQILEVSVDSKLWPPQEQRITYPKKDETDKSKLVISGGTSKQYIRRYGDLNNAELRVEELKNCVVVVTDNCKAVSIDQCVDCQFIICSCSGSIFVRDCQNTRLAAVTGQFRTRDCTRCAFFLHSLTDPVIEATENVKFFPFMFSMAQDHFDEEKQQILRKEVQQTILATKFSLFSNQYHKVYNFTPQKTSWEVLELPGKGVENCFHPPLFINLEDNFNVPENFINQTSNYTQTAGIPIIFSQKDVLPFKITVSTRHFNVGPLQALQLMKLRAYVITIAKAETTGEFQVTVASEGPVEATDVLDVLQ